MSVVVVIGAGMGGLAAALRLAQLGHKVRLLEARAEPGGLASGLTIPIGRSPRPADDPPEMMTFDGGPYVVLDRPGLAWAFERLGLDLEGLLALRRVEQFYEVDARDDAKVTIYADLDRTVEGIARAWPGAGGRYRAFVAEMSRIHARLQPLLLLSRPGARDLLRAGAWRAAPLLLRSLGAELRRWRLPRPLCDALAVWTHVAGQSVAEAPSLLAFVPALIHRVGAFVPAAGMRAIPAALAWAMEQGGVELSYGQPVRRIRMRGAAAIGVETATGELVDSDAVVSNLGGAATYLGLLDVPPARIRSRLEAMPLQSPGVCAYLAVRDVRPGPYLRFRLPGGRELCRLLVTPAEAPARGWAAARLIGPMRHAEAEAMGAAGQQAYLERLLQEDWWRAGLGEARVVGRRVPAEWAAEFRLHRSAMNPVMTARLMRAGRLAHRSPYVRRLYLAGSSTHPGQWVSFCAISGILAADALHADFGGAAA